MSGFIGNLHLSWPEKIPYRGVGPAFFFFKKSLPFVLRLYYITPMKNELTESKARKAAQAVRFTVTQQAHWFIVKELIQRQLGKARASRVERARFLDNQEAISFCEQLAVSTN